VNYIFFQGIINEINGGDFHRQGIVGMLYGNSWFSLTRRTAEMVLMIV